MTSPRRKYVFKSKRLMALFNAFLGGAVLAWWAWGGLVMSWAGHRPLVPTPATGQVLPYNNHGIMFVSKGDLDMTHMILAIGAVLGLLAGGRYLADRKPWRKPISN